jgi:iron complex outermembrane recepter protein
MKHKLITTLFIVSCLGLPLLRAQEVKEETSKDDADKKDESTEVVKMEKFVITGSRSLPRTVTESMVPIDVISGLDLSNQGDTDLSNLIRNTVPSFDVNTQPISDASTIVRPANLRGLAPDHTLVLINNKRRHRAAVIYWLGNGVADGAQGPDIATIPSIAVKQVEVLRDGAAAQYGSDAIAGVMNFMLLDSNKGGSLEARYGQYYEGDGKGYNFAGNVGLPLGSKGFANFSFEYGASDPTSRSVQRNDAAALIAAGNTNVANPAQIWGSPEIKSDLKLFVNFGAKLSEKAEFYGHANYVTKEVEGGFYFRNPNTRSGVFSNDGGATLLVADLNTSNTNTPPVVRITNNVPDPVALAIVRNSAEFFTFQEMFPGGFTPRFGGEVFDYAVLGGLKGKLDNGVEWDLSASMGSNRVDFYINNTVNASLGPNTPTNFDPGSYIQEETNLNLDVTIPVSDKFTLAAGAELREETFEIEVGQLESYVIGPLADQGFSSASNGFPGFSDIAQGKWSRKNIAAYVDGEWKPSSAWTMGVALRWEDFDDFGSTLNGKIAGRYEVNDRFALRGSFNTGFRAPTPGQSNAFNVSTQFDLVRRELVNNGTIPSIHPVARLRGGKPLDAETSVNYSLGTLFEVGSVKFSVDYFNINVEDRLAVSQNFSLTQAEINALVASGITSAANLQNFRFFTNDFETKTSGIDVVAAHSIKHFGGTTDLDFAFNYTKTEVTSFNPATLDLNRIRQLESALPGTRYSITANHVNKPWRLLARLSYFAGWYDSDDGRDYSGKFTVDMEAAYKITKNLTLVAGVQNILDETPDENPDAAAGVGNKYSQYSPFGFNGGFMYTRIKWEF